MTSFQSLNNVNTGLYGIKFVEVRGIKTANYFASQELLIKLTNSIKISMLRETRVKKQFIYLLESFGTMLNLIPNRRIDQI